MLWRLLHPDTLGDDHHVGSSLANLERFLQKRRVEGSLKVETEERLGQGLPHVIKKAIEDFAKVGFQPVAKSLLRIAQPLFEILQHARTAPEESDRHQK